MNPDTVGSFNTVHGTEIEIRRRQLVANGQLRNQFTCSSARPPVIHTIHNEDGNNYRVRARGHTHTQFELHIRAHLHTTHIRTHTRAHVYTH